MDNQQAINKCADLLPRCRKLIRTLGDAPGIVKNRSEAIEAREAAEDSIELIIELLARVRAEMKGAITE